VLELFWTLCRGARVLLLSEKALLGSSELAQATVQTRKIDFSLFYFANEDAKLQRARYRLLIEGARFADEHGFTAVWTPERHFHTFGGLYPNPSVTSAALATITEHVQLRAGSVVLPLHDPVRVAEEWSVVDNLSNGRVGLAFASGWHANDFVFFPQNYTDRKNVMFRDIQTVQRLWQGEQVQVTDGSGQQIAIQIFPPPLQSRLPIWITAAGSDETFIRAGEIGANVLTHLLGQSVEEVARKIQLYRASLESHGFARSAGHVTLMLHTFLGADPEVVRQKVQQPFTNYLRTSVGLIENLVRTLHLPLDLSSMSAQDMDDLLAFAVERYRGTSALFGTPEDCLKLVESFKAIEVDELACLIDFGIETADVLAGLPYLDTLRQLANEAVAPQTNPTADYSLLAQATKYKPTLMQCTPSAMRLLSLDERVWDSLASLRCLLLGGEALPASLVEQVQKKLPVRIENMYGPTETTVWSATHTLAGADVPDVVPIGYPIANTQIIILDRYFHPVPPGVVGEIYIGGDGLARGYLERPELTAERFLPAPSAFAAGQRLYRTGDLGRYRSDGLLEFLGRVDQQVKLRGFRIEPGEIEAALRAHPDVAEAVVNAARGEGQEEQLVAYLVPTNQALTRQDLRAFLKDTLPDYMIPSVFVMLAQLPLTANGKLDRKALSLLKETTIAPQRAQVMPRNRSEQIIAEIWSQALHVERVGVDENFFDLGGHSLLIAQIHAQLKEAFHQDIPLVKLLEYPTVGSFARYMQSLDTEQSSLQQSVERAKVQREAQLRRLQRLKS
jgi:natural product biosynthesis luciferase-like monooxygenase protein